MLFIKANLLKCNLDLKGEPTKPDLNIVKVNIDGTLYTWKLATYYFRRQPDNEDRDRCFIMTGSMVAWIDSPVSLPPTPPPTAHPPQNKLQLAPNRFIMSISSEHERLTCQIGKLGIHSNEVCSKRIHENCSS